MSRGLRNNNPGNIRISGIKYAGEIQPSQDRDFKQFRSIAYGYRAIFMLLYTYHKKHGLSTIRQIINRYAPPNENHTNSYIDTVAARTGIKADFQINTADRSTMILIVEAMSYVENGKKPIMANIEKGWDLFINSLEIS